MQTLRVCLLLLAFTVTPSFATPCGYCFDQRKQCHEQQCAKLDDSAKPDCFHACANSFRACTDSCQNKKGAASPPQASQPQAVLDKIDKVNDAIQSLFGDP